MPIYGAVIYGAALISAPACRHHGAVVSLWVGDLWGSADLWVRDLWGSDVWGGTDVCVLSATGITVLWFLWVGDLWGNANLWVWDVWVWDLWGSADVHCVPQASRCCGRCGSGIYGAVLCGAVMCGAVQDLWGGGADAHCVPQALWCCGLCGSGIYGAVLCGVVLMRIARCRHYGAVVAVGRGCVGQGSMGQWCCALQALRRCGRCGSGMCGAGIYGAVVLCTAGITALWSLWVGDVWGRDLWGSADLWGGAVHCRHYGAVVAGDHFVGAVVRGVQTVREHQIRREVGGGGNPLLLAVVLRVDRAAHLRVEPVSAP